MRTRAFIVPLTAALALAGAASAQPSSVNVTISPDFEQEAAKLGQRDVEQQVARLASTVERTLAARNALDGAVINLTITDLKPNRPTMQQAADKPGLDPIRSMSLGGASIEGTVTTPSGEVQPVKYTYYSTSIYDVIGLDTWSDAEGAYQGLARNLANGRFVSR